MPGDGGIVPQQHPEPWAPPVGATHGSGIASEGSCERQAVMAGMAAQNHRASRSLHSDPGPEGGSMGRNSRSQDTCSNTRCAGVQAEAFPGVGI